MDSDIRKTVIQRDVPANPYKMYFAKLEGLIYNKTYKTLVYTRGENDVVKGLVIDVSDEELIMIDRYETSMYKRHYSPSGYLVYVENLQE